MRCRGIRGATTSSENTEAAMSEATHELLEALMSANQLVAEDIAAMTFTCTPDLNAMYPAKEARRMGLDSVPLTCAQEMEVSGSLRRCIRVLVLVNTEKSQDAIRHIYLRGAVALRPEYALSRAEASRT